MPPQLMALLLSSLPRDSPAFAAFQHAFSLLHNQTSLQATTTTGNNLESSVHHPPLHEPCAIVANLEQVEITENPTVAIPTPVVSCNTGKAFSPLVHPPPKSVKRNKPPTSDTKVTPKGSFKVAERSTVTPTFHVGKGAPAEGMHAFKKYCKGRLSTQYTPTPSKYPDARIPLTRGNENETYKTPSPIQQGPKAQKTNCGGRVYGTPSNERHLHDVGEVDRTMGEQCMHNRNHAGENLGQYSIQVRLDALDDYYNGVHMDDVCAKYKIASRKSISRWLKEFGDGKYDDCFLWTLDRQKKNIQDR